MEVKMLKHTVGTAGKIIEFMIYSVYALKMYL